DSGMLQWLAEVPALSAVYGRHGPLLEHFMLRLAGVPRAAESFSPQRLLHALRRLVEQVELAYAARPEEPLTGSQVSARQLLDGWQASVRDIYSRR
ncbi:unnamed protein product, partial [Polarella glacialis]